MMRIFGKKSIDWEVRPFVHVGSFEEGLSFDKIRKEYPKARVVEHEPLPILDKTFHPSLWICQSKGVSELSIGFQNNGIIDEIEMLYLDHHTFNVKGITTRLNTFEKVASLADELNLKYVQGTYGICIPNIGIKSYHHDFSDKDGGDLSLPIGSLLFSLSKNTFNAEID